MDVETWSIYSVRRLPERPRALALGGDPIEDFGSVAECFEALGIIFYRDSVAEHRNRFRLTRNGFRGEVYFSLGRFCVDEFRIAEWPEVYEEMWNADLADEKMKKYGDIFAWQEHNREMFILEFTKCGPWRRE